MERDIFQADINKVKEHFNSHAHVERDDTAKKMLSFVIISTHTLTWSVTDFTLTL